MYAITNAFGEAYVESIDQLGRFLFVSDLAKAKKYDTMTEACAALVERGRYLGTPGNVRIVRVTVETNPTYRVEEL